MSDNLITDLNAGHALSGGIDNTGSVGSTNVEVFSVLNTVLLLAMLNNTYGKTAGSPHIVVVNTSSHDVNKNVFVTDFWDVNDLGFEGVSRVTEALWADERSIHLLRDNSDRWLLIQRADIIGGCVEKTRKEASNPSSQGASK
jgi:hypothetical protein